ncbi:MAG: DUF1109 family protein [Gammaproteobacteria bacterium]|nr:DUF1109 family protein [Gammaproteobacteria bacterium]
MSRQRQELISELASDLTPVTHGGHTGGKTMLWLLLAVVAGFGLMRSVAPFRPGSLMQLADYPQYALETLLGASAIGVLAFCAFRLCIPQAAPLARRVVPALALLGAWLAMQVLALAMPAVPPSMLGDRHHCYLEIIVYALPSLALGLWWARRLWPLYPALTGALIGLTAGAVPALAMSFACMYMPGHNLAFHLLPGLSVGALGALIGARMLAR